MDSEHAADSALSTSSATNDGPQNSSESLSGLGVASAPSPPKDSPDKFQANKQKSSSLPSKQHTTNKLNIDPHATLAAISAKLATVIPPAESEIVRINREALLTISKRYQQQVYRDKALDRQQLAQEEQEANGGGDYPSNTTDDELLASTQSSPTARQKAGTTTTTTTIPSALHESVIAEEWVNVHLETNGTFLLPATDIQALLQKTSTAAGGNSDDALAEDETFAFRKRRGDSGPLGRAGIDRNSLYLLGMPKDLVDRLYRALYVYTNGFHNIINEIAAHCPPLVEKHVSSNVWLTFLLLLEQCENGKYEMAMLKFKHATQEWRRQMQEEHLSEKVRLESQLHHVNASLRDEAMRSAEKSDMVAKLAADAASANQRISDQHHEIAAQAEQIRLLKLEILVHEDNESKLNDQLDDTRKDFEVANSERINALAERFALEEEMRKLQSELERIDAEKSNYAKRMHEGLFMNQALRATNETLKQNAVVLVMEKDKVMNEKDALQIHIEKLQQEIQEFKLQKAQVERELLDSQRKTQHLDVRIQTMKEQIEIEAVNNAKQVQEISLLKNEIDEEKVKVGVLEAKCNLLTAEKQNTGMRAQDKLRIERLLNQKLELENLVEAMKLDRAKDQEQIWNLRASLEALDTEMQHSKRVFSAGQQAFLHSERTCEQLRNQLQDVEKSYEKATKNLASLKERFKLFEENSKDQITKLEVELKVMNAQLREVSYANRDNTALIAELNKSLEVSSKELKNTKNRLEASEQNFNHLKNEKEDLQRDKTQRELQRSTSRNAIEMFIRSLQHILTLVKLDEYPFDEALRELLRMTHKMFGKELGMDKVLDDEDEVEEFEEELDEEDMLDEQRARRKLRKKGLLPPSDDASAADSDRSLGDGDEGEGGIGEDDGSQRRTQVTSMSRFRKSKLDKQVKKLQRDAENKAELVQSLEGVICEQADELAQLTWKNEQQERWLRLNENQKGLLCADIDATAIVLFQVRAAKTKAERAMVQAELDRDVEIERTMQMQRALENLRHQFNMQSAMNEDLLSKIWREYEHYLLMLSLRRDKASQATVVTAEQNSQTLVPQRNPATERARITSMYMPSANPTATTFENVIQQINNNVRVLLPEVSSDISVLHLPTRQRQQQDVSSGRGRERGPNLAASVVHTAHRGGGASSGGWSRRETDSPQYRNRYERTCGKQQQSPRMSEQLTGLPAIEQRQQSPHPHHPPPHIIRHVNEFGTRQDVLISPVYPPYFQDGATRNGFSTSKIPKKPEQHHRRYQQQHPGTADPDGERSSSPRQPTYKDPRRRFPPKAGVKRRAMTDGAVEMMSSEDAGDTGLRYHRGFLRTGMEVLRGAQQFPEDEEDAEYFDSGNESDDSLILHDTAVNRQKNRRIAQQHGSSSLSPHSPGRLEEAIRGYQKELDEEVLARRRRFVGYEKDNQVRTSSSTATARARNAASGVDGSDDGCSLDADVVQELDHSPFVPAVLYPLLPPQ